METLETFVTDDMAPNAEFTAEPPAGLLRLVTAGSVDNGKSTLVGRLLYDSKSVFADQLDAVENATSARGDDGVDLALLTDGLRSEREQGITIDVAYRYFATPKRRFILADTPGHVEYTRNMVTGASTAQVAIIVIDARQEITEQTRRHTAVAGLLRVPHVILAVNKMDLFGFDRERFERLARQYAEVAASLGVVDHIAIPVSALNGDNVVERSPATPWYQGPTLLEHLEDVVVDDDLQEQPGRFPVQYPLTHGPRAAGMVTAGSFAVGDEVVVLPSLRRTSIAAIDRLGTPVDTARAGESVALVLADGPTPERGDLIAPLADAPRVSTAVAATVCHVAERELRGGQRVLLRHGTRTVPATVAELSGHLDLTTLRRDGYSDRLAVNDMAGVVVRTEEPLAFDAYATSRATGSFLLIDPDSGATLTAGMIDTVLSGV